MIFQVILISSVYYLFNSILINNNFTIKGLLHNFILKNWFVVLYCVLYVVSPYINIIINNLNKKQYIVLLVILFSIFSIYVSFTDLLQSILGYNLIGISPIGLYGSQWGYTIVNFIFMYFIAGFIRRFEIEFKNWKLILVISISTLIITLWTYIDTVTACSYSNPFVIIVAVTMFLLFKNISMKNKFINILSRASFIVYLTHLYLMSIVRKITINSIWRVLCVEFIVPIVIYLVGFLCYLIYSLIFGNLMKSLSKIKFFKFEPLKKNDNVENSDLE